MVSRASSTYSVCPFSHRYVSPPTLIEPRSGPRSLFVSTRTPGSMEERCAVVRALETGPPTQNSARSPKPWRAASWVTICTVAPQSLIRADISSRAKASLRCSEESVPPICRLTTNRQSDPVGRPRKACLRRSARRQR